MSLKLNINGSINRNIVHSAEKSLGIKLNYTSDADLQKSLKKQGVPTLWKILKETHAQPKRG